MSKQQCEICGEMKSQQEMSKSYKHRCKECVARLTRINRQAAKQRAENISQQLDGTGYELVSPEDKSREYIRIATAAMQGILSNDNLLMQACDAGREAGINDIPTSVARFATALADALLNEIGKGDNHD